MNVFIELHRSLGAGVSSPSVVVNLEHVMMVKGKGEQQGAQVVLTNGFTLDVKEDLKEIQTIIDRIGSRID